VRKGGVDNHCKARPIVVENTYRGLVVGFHRLHLPRGFVGLESIRGPQLYSEPFSLDTLDRFRARYPAHFGLPEFRLYLPGDCSHAGNLVVNLC
jgi:hypothetical protein